MEKSKFRKIRVENVKKFHYKLSLEINKNRYAWDYVTTKIDRKNAILKEYHYRYLYTTKTWISPHLVESDEEIFCRI